MLLDAGNSSERPLFLVHGGGGSVRGYSELVRELRGHGPVYGLHASESEDDISIEALARDYLAQVRAVQPRGPYLLGRLVLRRAGGVRDALQLQAAGEPVALLALLDTEAPETQPRPAPDALGLLAAFGRMLGVSWQDLRLDLEHLRSLGPKEQLARVLEQSPSVDSDGAERLFALVQRLAAAQQAYVPASTWAGPALLFRSTDSRSASGGPGLARVAHGRAHGVRGAWRPLHVAERASRHTGGGAARPSVVEPPGIEPGSPGRPPGALPLSHDPM